MSHTDGGYIVRCSSCKTKNRIPADKAGLVAKCGKCKAPIDTQELFIGKPVIVTDDNFETKVLQSPIPVLLDCWATWCGPCQMMTPIMDQLAAEWKGKVRVSKLNVDENPRIATLYSILGVPTLMIFENGEMKDTLNGAVPKHLIIQKMSAYIAL